MPQAKPPAFNALKNAQYLSDPFIWLFEITSPTGGPIIGPNGEEQTVRLARAVVPVVWGVNATGAPLTWDPYPIAFGEIQQDSQGNINEIPVTFSNVLAVANRMYTQNNYLRNHRVTVRLVNKAFLADPSAVTTFKATVVSSAASWEAITLTLAAFRLNDFSVPQSLMTRLCRWTYRKHGCDFIGDPTNVLGNCAKTLEACEDRGADELANGLPTLHPRRFGGCPALGSGPVPLGIT